jgi:hypothetical protein
LHEFQYAVDMEPFMELPEIEPAPYRSETALIANANDVDFAERTDGNAKRRSQLMRTVNGVPTGA